MLPSVYKKLREWQEESNSINILITGKTGTGKSALINSIVGVEVTKEGNTLKPETDRIEHIVKIVGNLRVQVWDSPGLQDASGDVNEASHVQEIVQKCSEFDLLVYTICMSQSRILKGGPDCKAMQILSQPNALGPNMWYNTIIVLTFANITETLFREDLDESDPLRIEMQAQEKFRIDYQSSASAIQNILINVIGLPEELAYSIPIVPAGYKTSAMLLKYDSDTATGERYFWLSNLWLKALSVTKLNAKPAMIKLNEHRMAENPAEYQGRLKLAKAEIANQMPLIFGEKGAELGNDTFRKLGVTLGTTTGIGLGHILSWSILADQASKNKILTAEEYKELQKKTVTHKKQKKAL